MCGGLATAVAVYPLAWKRGVHGYRLVLVGSGASAVLGSATSFLHVRADIGKAAQAASWMIGSLDARDWADARIAALGLVVLVPVVLAHGRRLTVLETGDGTAAVLGVPRERSRLVLLGAGAGLTALAVAAAGPIPFVAMAAPQLARRVTRAAGPGVLSTGWTGAFLVTAADLATQRLTGSALLPVGVVAGVAGAPTSPGCWAGSAATPGCDGRGSGGPAAPVQCAWGVCASASRTPRRRWPGRHPARARRRPARRHDRPPLLTFLPSSNIARQPP